MNPTELLDLGDHVDGSPHRRRTGGRLEDPTPCSRWDLRQLLDHTIGSLTMLTTAVASAPTAREPGSIDVAALGSTSWDRAIAELASADRRAWRAPGVMDRTFDLPIGAQARAGQWPR